MISVRFRLTIFLLVYWSLLVNFGPSVHTHSFFGLHCDCGVAHSTENSDCCHGGCCSADSDAEIVLDFTVVDDVVAENELSPSHDCLFCKFFKYLNYSAADSVQWSPSESVHFLSLIHI